MTAIISIADRANVAGNGNALLVFCKRDGVRNRRCTTADRRLRADETQILEVAVIGDEIGVRRVRDEPLMYAVEEPDGGKGKRTVSGGHGAWVRRGAPYEADLGHGGRDAREALGCVEMRAGAEMGLTSALIR